MTTKPLALFYLNDANYGGWPSYVVHLCEGFKKIKQPFDLYKVRGRNETFSRPFRNGTKYTNVTEYEAVKIAKRRPSLIACMWAGGDNRYVEIGHSLLNEGAGIVIHDPLELKRDVVPQALAATQHPVIVIRKRNKEHMKSYDIPSIYVPHPYQRQSPERVKHEYAICQSRVDYHKNIELILEANRKLAKKKRITLYGHVHRPYIHWKLSKVFPEWNESYASPTWKLFAADQEVFQGAYIAATSEYAVDMSQIPGDGGGTQYTFMEAWDAEARLIINEGWLTGKDKYDEVQLAADFAANATELAAKLKNPLSDSEWKQKQAAGEYILDQHRPFKVAKKIMKVIA